MDALHGLALLRNDDESAFDYFFKNYYAVLCFLGFKITQDRAAAEEMASEALLKLWQNRKDMYNLSALQNFLFTVVKNLAINYLKSQKTRKKRELNYVLLQNEPVKIAENAIIATEVLREVWQKIDCLPPERRKVMRLLFDEGFSAREVADQLGISVKTVSSQKRKGIVKLRGGKWDI